MKATIKKKPVNIKKIISFPIDLWRHLNPTIRIILAAFILLNLVAFGAFFYLNRQNVLQSIKQSLPVSFEKEKGQVESPASSEKNQPQPPLKRPPKPPPPKDYDLKISDQSEGITVTVDYLASPKGGWFVIYKDVGGNPLLLEEAIPPYEAGTYSGIVFFLRTPTVSGQKYFAILHTEDGNGSFDFPGNDSEALNSKSEKVMQSFVVK